MIWVVKLDLCLFATNKAGQLLHHSYRMVWSVYWNTVKSSQGHLVTGKSRKSSSDNRWCTSVFI